LFTSLVSFAEIVSEPIAAKVAISFFKSVYFDKTGNSIDKLTIENTYSISSNNEVCYYIFNFKGYGFVQVSAEDAAYPILAFDFYKHVNTEIAATNYNKWVQGYINQIDHIREQNISATNKISNIWNSLKTDNNISLAQGKSVDPLLLSTWNQGSLYNADCPIDQNGPGGRVYAGCVAVAMAQIMYYYRYPYQGVGTKTYNHYLYGNMTADFGTTTYNWNAMANSITSGGNTEIAQLLYHLGISVEMDYSASGSGAYSSFAAYSLHHFFKYSTDITYASKSDFTYSQWVDKIVTNIDSGRPLYYDGFGDGGHAFNLDGYQGSDYFHFNWGWGGAFNGYYFLDNLNPGSSSFNNGQSAMFDVHPASSYPYFCNSTNNTYNTLAGNFSDGSGPADYNNNANCNWLIQPNQGIKNIKISFDRFEIDNSDTLFIYDGTSNSDSLLAKLTGDIVPNDIYSVGSSVFLEFISDNSIKSKGFDISYKSIFPIYCDGTALYTDSLASFEDGSGTANYNNSTYCKWYIKPTNGFPIRLFFDSFNLEYGNDMLKIYNPATTPSTLLKTITGNYNPSSIVSPSGEMMIVFISNNSQTENGWKAHYITGPSVGIHEVQKKAYNIYPNPANTYLNIKTLNTNDISNIQLLGLDGKIIRSYNNFNINNNVIKIELNEINNGIYMLHIISNNSSSIEKIIIHK